MTHTTEQERAEFEKAWRERPIYMGGVHQKEVAYIWWMQAARRAPAVPVPQVWLPSSENIKALPEPLRNYIRDLETNCDPAETVRHNTILKDQIAGLQVMYRRAADALAAAPQPPEAAPVQMPEPVGCTTKRWGVAWNTSQIEAGSPLYTEQQVRQLLAAHGIKEQST